MGEPQRNQDLAGVGQTAGTWYNNLMGSQTPLEKEYIPQSQTMWNNYMTGVGQNMQDYGNIMGGYQNFSNNISQQGPTKFGFERVAAERPAELGESYGYLRETMPGYRDFAQTGGYSPTDIQELRARGIAPIRAAYGNTMMELNRARALGGSGGAPNYIAAASKAQREMPGQMADAMTGVNAQLADAIRQGKLAGLSGMAGVGSTMGGLSSQEAGRMLQAAMANQNADLQAQQLSEQSLQALRGLQLDALRGQTSLYGTTPGLASIFGNQALQAYQNRIALENQRNQTGLGLINAQISAYGGQQPQKPWYQQVLDGIGSVVPYLGGGGNNQSMTPSGYNTPNNMGGNQFTGYMPTINPDNWGGNVDNNFGNPYVTASYSFPQFGGGNDAGYWSNPYDSWNDPYLNPDNWYGYGPATNGQQFTGWQY